MLCPNCKTNNAEIEQAPDSHKRIVKCYCCNWWCWLKDFNNNHTPQNEPRKIISKGTQLI